MATSRAACSHPTAGARREVKFTGFAVIGAGPPPRPVVQPRPNCEPANAGEEHETRLGCASTPGAAHGFANCRAGTDRDPLNSRRAGHSVHPPTQGMHRSCARRCHERGLHTLRHMRAGCALMGPLMRSLGSSVHLPAAIARGLS